MNNKNLVVWIPILATLLGGAFYLGNSFGAGKIDSDKLELLTKTFDLQQQLIQIESSKDTLEKKLKTKNIIISKLSLKAKKLDSLIYASQLETTLATLWEGKWIHTESLKQGIRTGEMNITINNAYMEGIADNYQGGSTVMKGELSDNGKILTGEWNNKNDNKEGIFYFVLQTNNYFVGNYAMKEKNIDKNRNKWTGLKEN